MNEIRFYKKFLKFLALLLQSLDIDKTKDDARKIGMTLFGAGFIGLMSHQISLIPGLLLIFLGLTNWYYGLTK